MVLSGVCADDPGFLVGDCAACAGVFAVNSFPKDILKKAFRTLKRSVLNALSCYACV